MEIQYDNKNVERITTADKTVLQILELVQNKAEEMDTAQKLKDAGLKDQQLESSWLADLGKETEVGRPVNIPRQ